MNSGEGSERRNWWDVRWSRSGAFRNERRHLIILSVLGGLVFFGAGLLSGINSTNAAASRAGSFSSTSKPGSLSLEVSATESTRLDAVNTVPTEASEQPKELKVRMYNFYTKNNEIELYPWEHLAEPHKPSTMELLDWPASDESLEYRWE